MAFNLPAYLKKGDGALTRSAMHGIAASQPPHIEISGGKFTLKDAGNSVLKVVTGPLKVVVLDANDNMSKRFFDKHVPFDPTNPQPPLCFSDNGVAPSQNAREPQHPTCGLCPHNVWGSAKGLGGNKIKACKDYKKIAVYVVSEKRMEFLLTIPPNSFSYWNKYCGWVGSQGGELWQIITEITFSADPQEPMTLVFDAAVSQNGQPVFVPQTFEGWYETRKQNRSWDVLIGRNDQPIEGALANMATPTTGADRNRTLPPARPTQATESPEEAFPEVEPATPTPPPAARRGRPPKAQAQAPTNGQDQNPNGAPDMPEFLKRTSPGMVGDAAAPDASMASALDDAFPS